MYDKLTMWLPRQMVGSDFSAIASRLTDATGKVDMETGEEVGCIGKLGNLDVSVKPTGVWWSGSIAKYNYPSNIFTLDRKETKQALESVSDALGLNIMDAKVIEMEFGTNFWVQEPVALYLSRLGAMPRKQRIVRGKGIYYEGRGTKGKKPEVVTFYDKVADSIAKGYDVPAGLEDAHLLRYELRFNGKLKKRFGQDVKASTLYNREFYQKMVNLYLSYYDSIKKQGERQTDVDAIKTPRGAFEVLVARLLAKNQQDAALFVEELKAAQVFNDPKCYSRLKRMIADTATKTSGDAEADGLIAELSDGVANVGVYL